MRTRRGVEAQDGAVVTLMFTDIEGSTKRWEVMPEAMAAALAVHDRLLKTAIEANHGTVFRTVGDAFCAYFASPLDAVEACLAGQAALLGEPWGEVGPIRVRMALHTGPVERVSNEPRGTAVHRVNQLLPAGHGGQILVSARTADALRSQLGAGVELRDLGNHRLKDVSRPEHIYQLVAHGLPDDLPPLKTLDRNPHNLPPQPFPLIGRDQERNLVLSALGNGCRLITLTGPAGIGRTRLAVDVAGASIEMFPDGAWFVTLAGVNGEDLETAIADGLGISAAGQVWAVGELASDLQGKTLAIVLDDVEGDAASRWAIGRLVDGTAGVSVIATATGPLRLPDEFVIPLAPLAVPPVGAEGVGEIAAFPAVELFVQRARAVHPGFQLTGQEAGDVAFICRALDGHPARIEAAATRIRVLTPGQLRTRLQRERAAAADAGR